MARSNVLSTSLFATAADASFKSRKAECGAHVPNDHDKVECTSMSTDDTRADLGMEATDASNGPRDRWDDFYKVPRVHHTSISELELDGPNSAVHTIALGPGKSLDFFAKLEPANELIVTFPGAVPRGKPLYPMFWRVTTFRKTDPALISFADPTILLDASEEMRVAWFLGGPDYDPAPLVLQVIREAKRKTGAEHVVFVGGSGGGLPALRLSSMLPGSMAYLHEGATNVARSIPRSVERYFNSVWPGWDQEQLIYGFPERFNMVRHYERTHPGNFVYFVQSEDDLRFRRDHYAPFREASGVLQESGETPDGRRHFILYKGEVEGHGKVTKAEFRYHFENGRARWRAWREMGATMRTDGIEGYSGG